MGREKGREGRGETTSWLHRSLLLLGGTSMASCGHPKERRKKKGAAEKKPGEEGEERS